MQLFPFIPFKSFVDCLAKGVPVRVDQRRSPPLKLDMFCVSEGPLRAHLVNPQRSLVSSSSDDGLWKSFVELRFFT